MPQSTECASVCGLPNGDTVATHYIGSIFNRTGIFTPIDVLTVRVMVRVTVRSGESVWSTVLLYSSDRC